MTTRPKTQPEQPDVPTSRPDWPRQLVLPGQTAAPDGPVDMRNMYVMHHAFRRDLDAFVEACRRTPVEDREAWQALNERWGVFAMALHHHHSGEDAGVWPVLVARSTPEEVETLDAMEAEHEEIDPLLRSCAEGFARLAAAADSDARAALEVKVTATRERLAHHLQHEETEAIVLIQRYLTDEEWRAIEHEHFRKGMPLSMATRVVPWAAYGLSATQQADVLSGVDVGFRLLHRLTRRGFARRHAVAFRYAESV